MKNEESGSITLVSLDGEAFRLSRKLLHARLPRILSSSSSITTNWSSHALCVLILWIHGADTLIQDIPITTELQELETTLNVDLGLRVSLFDIKNKWLNEKDFRMQVPLCLIDALQDRSCISPDLFDDSKDDLKLAVQELEHFQTVFEEEMGTP